MKTIHRNLVSESFYLQQFAKMKKLPIEKAEKELEDIRDPLKGITVIMDRLVIHEKSYK